MSESEWVSEAVRRCVIWSEASKLRSNERAAREGNDGGMVVGGINRGGDIMSGFDHPPAGTQAGRAACTRKKFFQLCRKEKPREFNLIRSWVSYRLVDSRSVIKNERPII